MISRIQSDFFFHALRRCCCHCSLHRIQSSFKFKCATARYTRRLLFSMFCSLALSSMRFLGFPLVNVFFFFRACLLFFRLCQPTSYTSTSRAGKSKFSSRDGMLAFPTFNVIISRYPIVSSADIYYPKTAKNPRRDFASSASIPLTHTHSEI